MNIRQKHRRTNNMTVSAIVPIILFLYSSAVTVSGFTAENRTDNNMFYFTFGEQLTFAEAESYCYNLDAKLASVSGLTEHTFIVDVVNDHPSYTDFWIGLSIEDRNLDCNDCAFNQNTQNPSDKCMQCRKKWTWLDGQSMVDTASEALIIDRWFTNEPTGGQNCARLSRESKMSYLWKDIKCDTEYDVICKRAITSSDTTSISSSSTPSVASTKMSTIPSAPTTTSDSLTMSTIATTATLTLLGSSMGDTPVSSTTSFRASHEPTVVTSVATSTEPPMVSPYKGKDVEKEDNPINLALMILLVIGSLTAAVTMTTSGFLLYKLRRQLALEKTLLADEDNPRISHFPASDYGDETTIIDKEEVPRQAVRPGHGKKPCVADEQHAVRLEPSEPDVAPATMQDASSALLAVHNNANIPVSAAIAPPFKDVTASAKPMYMVTSKTRKKPNIPLDKPSIAPKHMSIGNI